MRKKFQYANHADENKFKDDPEFHEELGRQKIEKDNAFRLIRKLNKVTGLPKNGSWTRDTNLINGPKFS